MDKSTNYFLAVANRLIGMHGFDTFCDKVQSPDLPDPVKERLSAGHILVDGYLNLSLVCPDRV